MSALVRDEFDAALAEASRQCDFALVRVAHASYPLSASVGEAAALLITPSPEAGVA